MRAVERAQQTYKYVVRVCYLVAGSGAAPEIRVDWGVFIQGVCFEIEQGCVVEHRFVYVVQAAVNGALGRDRRLFAPVDAVCQPQDGAVFACYHPEAVCDRVAVTFLCYLVYVVEGVRDAVREIGFFGPFFGDFLVCGVLMRACNEIRFFFSWIWGVLP